MPKAPTPALRGIPIGTYEEIKDALGKSRIKPKPKRKPLPQQIAARKRKRWRAAK